MILENENLIKESTTKSRENSYQKQDNLKFANGKTSDWETL